MPTISFHISFSWLCDPGDGNNIMSHPKDYAFPHPWIPSYIKLSRSFSKEIICPGGCLWWNEKGNGNSLQECLSDMYQSAPTLKPLSQHCIASSCVLVSLHKLWKNLWRWAVVSGTKTLAGDPSSLKIAMWSLQGSDSFIRHIPQKLDQIYIWETWRPNQYLKLFVTVFLKNIWKGKLSYSNHHTASSSSDVHMLL